MITIFNRKELIITHSMKEQARIRSVLANNHIDYSIRVKNLFAGGRGGRIAVSCDTDRMYEYRIFVHKKDYQEAYYQIHKKLVC